MSFLEFYIHWKNIHHNMKNCQQLIINFCINVYIYYQLVSIFRNHKEFQEHFSQIDHDRIRWKMKKSWLSKLMLQYIFFNQKNRLISIRVIVDAVDDILPEKKTEFAQIKTTIRKYALLHSIESINLNDQFDQ